MTCVLQRLETGFARMIKCADLARHGLRAGTAATDKDDLAMLVLDEKSNMAASCAKVVFGPTG